MHGLMLLALFQFTWIMEASSLLCVRIWWYMALHGLILNIYKLIQSMIPIISDHIFIYMAREGIHTSYVMLTEEIQSRMQRKITSCTAFKLCTPSRRGDCPSRFSFTTKLVHLEFSLRSDG